MRVGHIPASTLAGVTDFLLPHVPELTPLLLVAALRAFDTSRPPGVPPPFSFAGAGRQMGVSKWTVKRMVDDGILPATKIRGQWRIPADAVLRLARGES